MLDTIIVGLIILSALVYGFWQYFAEPDAHRKKKSEFFGLLLINTWKIHAYHHTCFDIKEFKRHE